MIPQLLLFALCAVPSQGYALRQGVTPVQKVIALLQDMMAKGKAEKVRSGIHSPEHFCSTDTFLSVFDCSKAVRVVAVERQHANATDSAACVLPPCCTARGCANFSNLIDFRRGLMKGNRSINVDRNVIQFEIFRGPRCIVWKVE